MRKDIIFYGKQYIDEDDIEAVCNVLRSDYLTTGPTIAHLEKKLCDITKAAHAVVVSNGTAALHCACIAAGISKGDEVITTPLTFAASANCILYCGGIPVFADVCMDTYNIDPHSIEDKITEKTKAVIAVDYTGQAVCHDRIRQICDKYNLVFIEDAAHAIGTKYNGQSVGTLADMTCFSFHPVKTVTCGEGGAILTNNEKYAKILKLVRTHGITHDVDIMEHKVEGSWEYEQVLLGYNYRLTDFQAALLLSQLQKLEKFKKRRKEIVKKYNDAFYDLSGIILQKEISESDTCNHLYIIRLDLDILTCTRREFFEAMVSEKIQPQVHYIPVYWFPYYQRLGYKRGICPNSENIYKSIISIPLYPKMLDEDVEYVIKVVKKLINQYRKKEIL